MSPQFIVSTVKTQQTARPLRAMNQHLNKGKCVIRSKPQREKKNETKCTSNRQSESSGRRGARAHITTHTVDRTTQAISVRGDAQNWHSECVRAESHGRTHLLILLVRSKLTQTNGCEVTLERSEPEPYSKTRKEECSSLATTTRRTASVHRGMSPPDETGCEFPQPTASYRHEIRLSGWVHGRVAACASDLLLVSSLHTHGMWFRQREIVANLREQGQGRFVPDNFLHRLREVVNVPHNCLVTVSVAMHTGQLWIARSLRIQGLPLP